MFLATPISRGLQAVLLASTVHASALAQEAVTAVPSPELSAAVAPSFDILEFQVEGNSVLSVDAIERAVTPFLGERRTMVDAEGARVALEKAYQGAGFLTVFVDVPEQRVDAGVVILNVTEGRVERLKVSGSRYFSQGYIRAKVSELADGKVPNFNEVQRQLALVNRTEERRVQPIMRAGMTPGTVETELKVDDKLPLAGSVDLSNRAAAGTAPLRLSASARYENLFQLDHSLALTLATAPQDIAQSRVVSVNYTVPGADASAWVGYVVHSDSAVAALGDVNVLGKGLTLGVRHVMPLTGAPEDVHSVSLGVDYKDLQEQTHAGSGAGASLISTPLRYLPLEFGYSGAIDHGAQRKTLLSVQATVAFRRVLARQLADCPGGSADQFACKRMGGDGGFATLRGEVRHALPIAFGLHPLGSLNLRFGAQLATGPVPSGEQFAIGGAESVRGYYEAEGAGDRAVLGSVEWRSPDFGAFITRGFGAVPDTALAFATATSDAISAAAASTMTTALPPVSFLSQTHALAFVDVARAYVFEPATGQAPHVSLAGAGIGLRSRFGKSVGGEFDLAWPFKATAATPARSPRAHVKVALQF